MSGGAMWGGRFAGALHPVFAQFNQSLPVDQALVFADVDGSVAWAEALAAAGVLTAAECDRLVAGLEAVLAEVEEHGVTPDESEDIHSWVETRLTEQVGPLAKKLHTGRSRNDQVATDLKLHLKGLIMRLWAGLTQCMTMLVAAAESDAATPLPGYTHLQRAQPITVGHWAMSFVEMLARDRERVQQALERMDTCPLGSGALAGTAFPIDREALAVSLGFDGGATRNSLDAVSDRDHLLDLLFACSTTMLHLSRWAEDAVFFTSQEAGLAAFGDDVSTGSSLMPQKKNPDAAELIRGRTGRTIGALQGLMLTLKGLPSGYNKDLQEDKALGLDALESTADCLQVAALAIQSLSFDPDRCRAAAASGYQNATDLADLLVQAGVPFRDAHARVGQAVCRAMELGVELEALPDGERDELLPELKGDLAALLSVDAVLARRSADGGTAPDQVRQAIEHWREILGDELEEMSEWLDDLDGDEDLDDPDRDADDGAHGGRPG